MIDWLIQHYAEIAVYSGVIGVAIILIISITLLLYEFINNIKKRKYDRQTKSRRNSL